MLTISHIKRSLLAITLLLADRANSRGSEPVAPVPVVVVRISNSLISEMMDQEITRDSAVRENFQGTEIVGTSHTQGRPQVKLQNNASAATFDVVFAGSTSSKTEGRHPPVVVYSHSCTQFSAVKRIVFEPGNGFRSSATAINSKTQVVTDGISTNRRGLIGRIIQRKAWAEVEAQSAEGLAFAKRNTEGFVVKAFDETLAERLAKLNEATDVRHVTETQFKVKLPPIYQCSTHDGYIQFAITTQPGTFAELNLPALTVKPLAVQMWLHKSLIDSEIISAMSPPSNLTGNLNPSLPQSVPAILSLAMAGQKSLVHSLKANEFKSEFQPHTPADDWLVFQFTGEHWKSLATQKKQLE